MAYNALLLILFIQLIMINDCNAFGSNDSELNINVNNTVQHSYTIPYSDTDIWNIWCGILFQAGMLNTSINIRKMNDLPEIQMIANKAGSPTIKLMDLNGEYFIFYDSTVFGTIKRNYPKNNRLIIGFTIAHELAHFVLGHQDIHYKRSRDIIYTIPNYEFEADNYACFLLRRMYADTKDVETAVNFIACDTFVSMGFPRKERRIDSIKKYFEIHKPYSSLKLKDKLDYKIFISGFVNIILLIIIVSQNKYLRRK